MLTHLNPPQREAVLHPGGPLVVFAGAGSGKTRVITRRIAHLLLERDVAPWRILAVTFTNKAAGEMRERIGQLAPGRTDGLTVGTFHATCARLLRKHAAEVGVPADFNIYDDQDQLQVIKRASKDLGLDTRRYPERLIASRIDRAKQEAWGPGDLPIEDDIDEVVRRVYEDYEKRLERAGALDFGDLLFRLVRALEANDRLREHLAGRFAHVLVDEFQDTNAVQLRLVRHFASVHRNLLVVGDDDQSIYRWRGADRRNILDFHRAFPDARTIKLEQNYRSTQRILRAANGVIARNLDRQPKTLFTENDEGEPLLVLRVRDEREEARAILRGVAELSSGGTSLAEISVFYRVHAQSRVLEEALRAANVPYRIVGGQRFYEREEIKNVLAFFRVVHNPEDDVSLDRVLDRLTRGIGKQTRERIFEEARARGTSGFAAMLVLLDAHALGPRSEKPLVGLVALLRKLRHRLHDGGTLAALAEAALEETGYRAALTAEDTPEADARLQNLEELVGSIGDFERETIEPTLAAFLERVTLESDVADDEDVERLTLMTVHAAKGLEFDTVFVAGLEEGAFPLVRGDAIYEDPEEIEEERRLAYVAFTRARKRLILTHASIRTIYGRTDVRMPSRFLDELPPADVQRLGESPAPEYRASASPPVRASSSHAEPTDEVAAMEPSEEGVEVWIGMPVRHSKFGTGEVRAIVGGYPPRLRVRFRDGDEKTIVATYLELG